MEGYDLKLIKKLSEKINVPIIASGGLEVMKICLMQLMRELLH